MLLEKSVPRKMSEEKEKEFEQLSQFLEYFSTNVTGIERNDDIHPSNVLVRIVEQFGKSKALQGLKQAINDTIEDSSDFSVERVQQLDAELASKGIITLSILRKRYWGKYKAILKRGKIRNETEYYLINGVLCDTSAAVSDNERETLSSLINEYEQKA
jgi:hypothetical protein